MLGAHRECFFVASGTLSCAPYAAPAPGPAPAGAAHPLPPPLLVRSSRTDPVRESGVERALVEKPETSAGVGGGEDAAAEPSVTGLTTYFRDHATPYECLQLPYSPTPRPPIGRIARPPTPQLASRFDSRATHARELLPEALAYVPFRCVLVRVRAICRKQKECKLRPDTWPT
jgi:hypothetical protein